MRKVIIVLLLVAIVGVALWFGLHKPQHSQMSHNQTSHKQITFSGIGMMLTVKHHQIFIANVVPDAPAAKAGLHGSLIIEEVNGTNVENMPLKECVDMTRGPVGTTVQLEVIDPSASQTNTVEITREEIIVPIRQPPTGAFPAGSTNP